MTVRTSRERWPLVVPFVGSKPDRRVRRSLRDYSPLYVRMEDDEHYWRLLCSCWKQRETFLVVEQDVVPHRGAMEELRSCSEHWCAFPYMVAGKEQAGLGCVKFSGKLTAAYPETIEEVRLRHWSALDVGVTLWLVRRGFVPHLHEPAVRHLNPRAHVALDPEVAVGGGVSRKVSEYVEELQERIAAKKASGEWDG